MAIDRPAKTPPLATVSWRPALKEAVAGAGGIITLLLVAGVFTLLRPGTFLTSTNLSLILSQTAITAILAGGLSIALTAGSFDLSFGATVALSGVVAAKLLNAGLPWPAAAVLVLGVGALIGLINGGLVTIGKVPAIVATLGMSSVITGVVSWTTNDIYIPVTNSAFISFGRGSVLGIPNDAIVMLVVCGVGALMMRYAIVGRNVQAVGRNIEASRLAGIPVSRYVAGALAVTGLCAGFAAILETAKLGAGHPEIGPSYLLPTFAAAYVGAAASRTGTFSFQGSLYGALLLATLSNGLVITNAPAWSQEVATGLVLLAAVSLSRLTRSRLDQR